ncbi:MAG TPA: hypothetical protein VMS98_20475 [Thermoanaerobaculia bacterium]|nr:hypothetical protein [Thermoanaerobaculia bacterium]
MAADTSYLYRVRVHSSTTSAISEYSKPHIATSVAFTDVSLAGVTVKALHLLQVRTAVRAARVLAGLPAVSLTDETITPGVTLVKAIHISELRAALAEALADLDLPPPIFTTPTLQPGSTVVRAAEIIELRNGVK